MLRLLLSFLLIFTCFSTRLEAQSSKQIDRLIRMEEEQSRQLRKQFDDINARLVSLVTLWIYDAKTKALEIDDGKTDPRTIASAAVRGGTDYSSQFLKIWLSISDTTFQEAQTTTRIEEEKIIDTISTIIINKRNST